MTIVRLVRVTFYGLLAEKERVLDELQMLGCLHLVPLAERDVETAEGPSPAARDALKFLLACRTRRRQVHDEADFEAEAVQNRALAMQAQMRALQNERDALVRRIARARPWGEFAMPPPEDLGGLRLWFYVVPHYRMKELSGRNLVVEVVRRDNRFSYIVVLAHEVPEEMPVAPEELDPRPLSMLERRLEQVEIELEDLEAERAALTRWCDLLARDLHRLEDRAALAYAALHTEDAAPLFALQGWAPAALAPELEAYAAANSLAVVVEEPGPADAPPTLMDNPEPVAAGQDLVNFYSTPGYWNWDPSVAVFVSFINFFAIIVSDAGYALLWTAVIMLLWRRMATTAMLRRLRTLFLAMGGAALVWGLLVGSFFGLSPPAGSPLRPLAVIDLADHGAMMRLTILIGAAHVVAGNLGLAWSQRTSARALAPLGWCAMILGALGLWLGAEADAALVVGLAPWIMAAGGALVLLFTSAAPALRRRLLGGLLALARIPTAFGDVLSYLRLFALGLASTSLAIVFNELAGDVARSVPGIGFFLAILIVILGHAMNFALALVGGFVHGLRLNYIEFFNWSLAGEGFPFRPFAKKESATWTRS